MNYVIMAVVGLVVGILARYFYPGPVEMSLIMSAVLGIAGSFLAGVVGSMVHKSADGRLHPAGFVWSIVGAMLLIWVARTLGYA
jgi:uncharacterized membrane protein YeaQ/YmgE (transglycosylase-associated protein family)